VKFKDELQFIADAGLLMQQQKISRKDRRKAYFLQKSQVIKSYKADATEPVQLTQRGCSLKHIGQHFSQKLSSHSVTHLPIFSLQRLSSVLVLFLDSRFRQNIRK